MIIDGKEQRVEYPATSSEGKPSYIYNDRGVLRYPANLDTFEIVFPRDPVTNEEIYLPNLDGNFVYPSNILGREYYRKDANNNEIPISDQLYASYREGTQIYPRYSNGDEYYLKTEDGLQEIEVMMIEYGEHVHYYAHKKNGDEFYPRKWIA